VSLMRFFRRSKRDEELARELDSHLAHEIDDNLARGMNAEEARRQAYLKLGNPLRIRDTVWETNRIAWLEDTWRDFRYAARTLAKTPGFTIIAALVMALGIGANTAIYSFLDSLLLRSLPVSDPASLVVLNWHAKASLLGDSVMQGMSGNTYDDSGQGSTGGIFPYPAFELFQKNDAVFSDVFAYCHTREVRNMNVAINGQAEIASGELVSGNYFQGLAVQPAAGRLIIPDDDRTGAAAVAVVSRAFSEKYFGRAGSAAGQSVLINNLSFVVVGVTPAEFFGVDPATVPDIYIPMHTNLLLGAGDTFAFRPADYLDNNYYWVEVMARLRPGVSLVQAQAALAPRFQQWVATTAGNDAQRANLPALALETGATGLDTLRRKFSKPLYVLMTLVALILAIACSNVANLLLARAATRKREIALRMSVGAGRLRVIRQLLTESILLASLGGALGVLIAVWGIRLLTLLLAGSPGNATVHAHLNWHVLGVAAALSIFTGVLFGLAPALQSTRFDLVSALKEIRASQPHARDSSSRIRFARIGVSRIGVSQVLLVGQIALSLLMLVAAGLFVRTLSNLQSVELGFNRENLLLFQLNARQSGHRDPEIIDFYAHLRDRLATIPGVRNASLTEDSLINGENQLPISLPGLPIRLETRFSTVGPDFMSTMQIPILAGRDIEARDHAGAQRVVVISERFARINFPGQNSLGRHVILWNRSDEKAVERDMEIVGVSKDARYGDLKRDILPVVYLPYDQGFPQPNQMTYILRTSGDPLSYVNSVREVVRQADGRIAISDVRTQTGEINEHLHQEIVLADLCSAFAMLALTIACVGLYGTMSYTVARRTGEMGIRMALGAPRSAVIRAVLREVFLLVAVGLAISVPAALGTSRFLESLLFGMKPNDPLALTLAAAILLGAALLAGYVPARRASRIDPMTALRHE
jgi:macrolide transport system ATP-binding/permease protein